MATTKSAGTARNLTDSNPKYLGVKRSDGSSVSTGEIIVRQRGTKILPGRNIGVGVDHTLFAILPGKVRFSTTRKTDFDGKSKRRTIVHVIAC